MKKLILIIIIILVSNILVGDIFKNNSIDDRIDNYESRNQADSTLVKLYEQAYEKYKVSDPLKSIYYLKKIAKYHEDEGDIGSKYHRYVRIGQLYQQLGLYNVALEYLLEASVHFLKMEDQSSLAWLYSDIGNVYFAIQQYDIAEPYYHAGLEIMESLQDEYGQSVMHNNIALCSLSNGKIDDSFFHLQAGLKLRESVNNIYAIYHSKYLIGKNYFLIGDFANAEKYLQDIWTTYLDDELYPDEATILRSSAGLGLYGIWRARGDNSQAEKYLDESIDLINEVGDYFSLSSALSQKAHYFIDQNKYNEAITIFEEIFAYAQSHGYYEYAHNYAEWLVRLNFRLNNNDKSKEYFNTYVALTDSLISQRSSDNLVKLHSIVQTHMKEVENVELKARETYFFRLLLISTLSLLVIIILVISIYIKDKRNLDKIRNLANASSEAIVVHDRGNIIDTNNQFKRIFFNNDSKVNPSNLLELSPESEKKILQNLLFANEKVVIESHLINNQADIIDVRISSRPYIYKRKEVRVALIQDTTQVNAYIKSIKQAEDNLKVLNSTKDRLFSIIGHDLKNPFNAIIGFTNLMKDSWREQDPEDIDEMIVMINESSISAHTLLENLLDWARIQTEQLSFEPKYIRFYDAVNEVISLLSAQIKLKNISIFIDCPLKLEVFADARMLSTIIRNILSNSLKFTNRNGEIIVRAARNESSVMITIEDDGVGMTSQQIDNIFELDFAKSSSGTNNEKGTGLGLVLCHELIEYHKGKIEIESQLNIGTKTFLILPDKS